MYTGKQYRDDQLQVISFPLGGIGAGMFCLEGTGSLGSFSMHHHPDLYHEPNIFSAVYVKDKQGGKAKVLEAPVPRNKVFGRPGTLSGFGTNANFGKTYGLPRFSQGVFQSVFPFASVQLTDDAFPLSASVEGFSPFIPGNSDDSSLPAATLIYTLQNLSSERVEGVYYFNAFQFMVPREDKWFPRPLGEERMGGIHAEKNQLRFYCQGNAEHPENQGECIVTIPCEDVVCNGDWFQGGWFDVLSMVWKDIAAGIQKTGCHTEDKSEGGSLSLGFTLKPGQSIRIPLHFVWYVPHSDLRCGGEDPAVPEKDRETYTPWYAVRYSGAQEILSYYMSSFDRLYQESKSFSKGLQETTLPESVMEAVVSNLSILKSPTVLRQKDGRIWQWEGCGDTEGSCHGSCTHVWNYAQAIPHLFPSFERGLRYTEFHEDQNEEGHQEFRTALPIRPSMHTFHAASDGQLGGIMKVYREWRISGDDAFLKELWPLMKVSMEYCMRTWDPDSLGVLTEPHHNTYDIEFWGPDGMCSSFYLGALKAMCAIGTYFREDVSRYQELYEKGKSFLEEKLFNGEYFYQEVWWENLKAQWNLSEEPASSRELILKEGPKYQYGTGCLSDGVLGDWIARVCGLGPVLDPDKVKSHLLSVFRYNFRKDFSNHENPQRPGYALGKEGGLLLCSWPKGGRPSLPFVYSDEVWTGIEHQVAAHLAMLGCREEAETILQTCRARYDGAKRNPFNEYECGNYYARALASYGYLQTFSGVRYDAVEKTLYYNDTLPDGSSVFLSGNGGWGMFTLKNGTPFFTPLYGSLDIQCYRKIS